MRVANALRAVSVAVANSLRPSYLSMLTHATFAYDWDKAQRGLKAINVGELVKDPIPVSWLVCPQLKGESPPQDIVALAHLVRLSRPRTIFEIGTFRGQTTVSLAMNAPDDAKIYTLDLPPQTREQVVGGWDKTIDDQVIGTLYKQSAYASRITQLYADSRKFDTTPYRGQMDFIFVDGCHEEGFVESDSKKALEMLSPRGVLAWHDYGPAYPAVPKYLESLAATRPVYWIRDTQIAFVANPESLVKVG